MNISLISKSLRAFLVAIIAVLAFGSVSTALAVPPFQEHFGPDDLTGFFVGDCGDFNVLLDFTIQGHVTVNFDQDGVLVAAQQHLEFPNDKYYNSVNPDIFFTGNAVQNEHFDLVSGVVATTGLHFNLTIPGHGVVFHQVGQIIFDLATGDVLFQAGPADFEDDDIAALCAALTP